MLNLVINACQALRERSNGIFIAPALIPCAGRYASPPRRGLRHRPRRSARLFDPFFTTKRGRRHRLGLSISDTIIKAHRGSSRLLRSARHHVVMSLPT